MADSPGTLETLGRHLALALQPLRDAFRDLDQFKRLMFRMGWRVTDLPAEYQEVAAAADDALAKLEALENSPSPSAVSDLVLAVRRAYEAVRGIATAPPGVDAGAFLAEIGERLFELLLTDYLAAAAPRLYNLLSILHVIQLEHVPGAADRPPILRVRFLWAEIPKIITEPAELPGRVYGWGTPDLNVQLVVDHLMELFFALGLPVSARVPDEELAREYSGGAADEPIPIAAKALVVPFTYVAIAGKRLQAAFALRELAGPADRLPGLGLEPRGASYFPLTVPLSDTVGLRITAGTNIASKLGILIRPGEVSVKYPFQPGTAPPSAGIGVGFDFKPAAPEILLGSADA